MPFLLDILNATWVVVAQMAPYLLFGFLIAGILSVLIKPATVERFLGGTGFGPVWKASVFGVPLPLCSCGVIPVGASLRRHGAGQAATVSFLLSTPQTGIDSIAATYGLMAAAMGVAAGGVFTGFRVLVALLSGMIGGGLVALLLENAKGAAIPAAPACTDACCSGDARGPAWVQALYYGFVTLPRDLAKTLLFGMVVAGLVSALVPQNALHAYLGGGIVAVLVAMLLGLPIYVCATASVPIAIGLIHAGASPGAALAFLIAGPATNAATIAVVWKVLGRGTTLIYLGSVALAAVLAGLGLDALYAYLPGIDAGLRPAHHHAVTLGWWEHVTALALLGMLLGGFWPRRAAAKEEASAETPDGLTLRITGMTCGHCVEAVTRTLHEMPGVRSVRVDLDDGRARIEGEALEGEALARAVRELGYGAQAGEGE